jgi:rhodanese-related sulfurtransferase
MIEQIRPGTLPAWLEAVAGATPAIVLDVREPSELQLASVKTNGFELVKIPMSSLAQRVGELDPNRPVACLCHHGQRSMRVAAFLQSQGFTTLANIAGGIHAWSAEVDPSVPQY